jgi:glucan biosynthesis protein C
LNRDPSVETIRGFAVVLVVLFHATASMDGTHLTDEGISALEWVMGPLILIRMPLFAAISGYVSGLRKADSSSSLRRLVAAKARRLLVPFTSMLILILLVREVRHALRPGQYSMKIDPGVLVGYFVYGFEHLWFLQALFLMVVGFQVLERLGCVHTFRRWMATMITAALLVQVLPSSFIFNLHEALWLLPSFLVGVGLARFPARIYRRSTMVTCMLAAVVGFGVVILTQSVHPNLTGGRNSLIGMIAAMAAIPVIFRRRIVLPVFPTLATYSYSIYLFHTLGLYVSYCLSNKLLRGQGRLSLILFSAFFAIAFSAAAHHLITCSPLLSFLFLGERASRRAYRPLNVGPSPSLIAPMA